MRGRSQPVRQFDRDATDQQRAQTGHREASADRAEELQRRRRHPDLGRSDGVLK
jgi:hypothetical protein